MGMVTKVVQEMNGEKHPPKPHLTRQTNRRAG